MPIANGFSVPNFSGSDVTKAPRRTTRAPDSMGQASKSEDEDAQPQAKWLNFVVAAASAVASYASSRSQTRAAERANEATIAANRESQQRDQTYALQARRDVQDGIAGYRQFYTGPEVKNPDRMNIAGQLAEAEGIARGTGGGSGAGIPDGTTGRPTTAPQAGYQPNADQSGRSPERQAVTGTGRLSADGTLTPSVLAGEHNSLGHRPIWTEAREYLERQGNQMDNTLGDPRSDMRNAPGGSGGMRERLRRIFNSF